MKVCCVFSLESPQYTKYTIFNIIKKITLNYPKSEAMGIFPRDSRTSSKQPWFTSHQCSSQYILMDKSSAWSNFVISSLKCFNAHTVKNLNIESEKSEQTLFVQISLSQYKHCLFRLLRLNVKIFILFVIIKHLNDHNTKLDHA